MVVTQRPTNHSCVQITLYTEVCQLQHWAGHLLLPAGAQVAVSCGPLCLTTATAPIFLVTMASYQNPNIPFSREARKLYGMFLTYFMRARWQFPAGIPYNHLPKRLCEILPKLLLQGDGLLPTMAAPVGAKKFGRWLSQNHTRKSNQLWCSTNSVLKYRRFTLLNDLQSSLCSCRYNLLLSFLLIQTQTIIVRTRLRLSL